MLTIANDLFTKISTHGLQSQRAKTRKSVADAQVQLDSCCDSIDLSFVQIDCILSSSHHMSIEADISQEEQTL